MGRPGSLAAYVEACGDAAAIELLKLNSEL